MEYVVDFDSAMADFSPDSCSFRGMPTFHRIWGNDEFADVNKQRHARENNWLVRMAPDKDWEWIGTVAGLHSLPTKSAKATSCSSWKEERPYSIVIIGDSQPSYTCNHLVYGLTGDKEAIQTPKVRCVQIKRTLQNLTTFEVYASELQHSNEDFVIFNPSGLREAAYGSLDDFRVNFQRLLTYIPTERITDSNSINKQHYFFAPTTAVHPINYPNLPNDDKKWSMTQPRVQSINRIAAELVMKRKELYKSKAHDTISISNLPAPWDMISLSREDDPLTPTDMRHFNSSTNEMLLISLLCELDQIWQDG